MGGGQMKYRTTKHSSERIQQRGFTKCQITNLLELSDLTTAVDRNLSAMRVSRLALEEAVADGLPRAAAERLCGRVIIFSDDGFLVSIAHLRGRKSAYKRRGRRAFWK